MSDLDYRSWGETHNCHGCRYWSEMLASVRGGVLRATCIGHNSPNLGKETTRQSLCEAWEEGSLGAVDQPGGDPYAEVW